MRRKGNRSILTMGITVVVILLFIWHFNRRFEQLKSKRHVETTAPSTEQIEEPSPGAKNVIPLDAGGAKRPILACFCADWHHSCQEMSRLMEKMRLRFGDRLQVRVIDPSDQAELARQFRIDSLPTVVLFDANGKLVLRSEGAMTEKEMLEALSQAGLDGH